MEDTENPYLREVLTIPGTPELDDAGLEKLQVQPIPPIPGSLDTEQLEVEDDDPGTADKVEAGISSIPSNSLLRSAEQLEDLREAGNASNASMPSSLLLGARDQPESVQGVEPESSRGLTPGWAERQPTEQRGGSQRYQGLRSGRTNSMLDTPHIAPPRHSWTVSKTRGTIAFDDVRDELLDLACEDWEDKEKYPGSPLRQKVHDLVTSRYFHMVVSVFIGLNAVYVGVETDYGNPWSTEAVRVDGIETAFAVIFTLELALRLFAARENFFWGPFQDVSWNIFDFGLVFMGYVDILFISLFFNAAAEDLEGFGVLRVLRVLRVVRVLRLLQFLQELWLLVTGVLDAMRTLVWAWLLIFLIIYMFSVVITGGVGKPHSEDQCLTLDENIGNLFGTIYKTMFTLFAVMTIDDWGNLAKCAMEVEGWTWILFVGFLLCTSFGMLNVIIAVIVEGTLDRAMQQTRLKSEQDDRRRRHLISHIVGHFYNNKSFSGVITREEYLASLRRRDFARTLLAIGVEDLGKARNLFDILDCDSSGSLDITDFIHGMLRARGEAASKDVFELQCDVHRAESYIREEIQDIKERFFHELAPIEQEIEAAHVEVRKLICALEAGQKSTGSEDTHVSSLATEDCPSLGPSPSTNEGKQPVTKD